MLLKASELDVGKILVNSAESSVVDFFDAVDIEEGGEWLLNRITAAAPMQNAAECVTAAIIGKAWLWLRMY